MTARYLTVFQLSYRLKHVRGVVRVISLGETLITCFAGIL